MKKALIILFVIIGLILATLLAIPFIFRGDISDIIEKKSAKYLNAKLQIDHMSLNMFSNFPYLNVKIEKLILTGKGEFAKDTLLYTPVFNASVNVLSLIKGKEIDVNEIQLKNARVNARITANGKPNWDILISKTRDTNQIASPQELSAKKKKVSDKSISLQDISVEDLMLTYVNEQTATYAEIEKMNLHLTGNLSEEQTLLNLSLNMQNISYKEKDNTWVNHLNINWNTDIAANFKNLTFDIEKNDLALNDLKLNLTGCLHQKSDHLQIDMQLNAPDNRFESLFALLPKAHQHYLNDMKASGDFTLKATAKGDYYPNHLPELNVHFTINEASIQYKSLPQSIEHINLDLNIANPGGPADSTRIDLNRLAFKIADNTFQTHLLIAGLSDPQLEGGVQGVIDFDKLRQALPLPDMTLKGIVSTNLSFQGKYNYIQRQEYEKFSTKGELELRDIVFINPDFPNGISIPQASITVTPGRLNLNKLDARINTSDFTLQGYLSDYLPFFLKKGILKGNFSLSSDQIDLNSFKQAAKTVSDTVGTTSQKTQQSSQAPLIPENIDLQLSTDLQTVIYDRLKIQHIKGNIRLAQATATLSNLNMNLLGGNVVISGTYNTQQQSLPRCDVQLKVSELDIHQAYESFSFIRKSIPIAMNCSGKISSELRLATAMDYHDMSILMKTANGQGYIASKGILINDNPVMQNLATVIKNDELSRLSISSLKINFKIQNGNITLEPFKTSLAGNPVTLFGTQTVDGRINYTLSMNVDRRFFGSDIENLLQSIPGSKNIKNLDLDAQITGTLSKPEIKPDLTKAINTVRKAAEKDLKNKALKGLEKWFK